MLTKKGPKAQKPDIKNIENKLKAIGLDFEYVTSKEDIIIYMLYYLGCITIEQLCVLFGNLETSIKTSIAKILKNGDMIEIKKDEVNNNFYLPTRKTLAVLNEFCDVTENRNYKNIKHLIKINDFFITLFKSFCDKVTVEYERILENEVLENCNVRADAIINVRKDDREYEFILEQDNNTENITRLYKKIENYYNIILHEKMSLDKVRYYFFRFDVLFNKNYVSKYESMLNKSKEYKEMLDQIDKVQDFYYDVGNNDGPEEYFESRADIYEVEYSNKHNILMKNISTAKSELLKEVDKIKRSIRTELSSIRVRDRIEKFRAAMLKEFKVKSFDVDSDNTIFNDITRQNRFGTIYSVMEAEDILLRTNILCGDIKTDYLLKDMLFGIYREEHYLKTMIRESFSIYDVNFNDLHVKQVFKTIGYQTLCFSHYCTVHLNKEDYDVDCVLLMPTISISDYCKIEYLINLDLKQIHNSFANATYFYIITTDDQMESFYKEKIKKINNPNNKIGFNVYPININVSIMNLQQ